MNTKIIKLDINNKMYETITAKQGDTESRFLLFHLFDASLPFDLTEKSVRVYGIKPDGTKIFNDLVINDVKKGYCTLKLTNQMLAIAGLVKLELVIYSGNKKLSSIPFMLNVISSLNSDDAVVSTNEFTSLMNGLAALSEYDIYKSNAKQVPGIKEEVSNLSSQLEHIETQKATKQELDVERRRMDSFTKLQEGSTTGDAELIDGRNGADGVTYENIGDAIRKQLIKKQDAILEYETIPITLEKGLYNNITTVVNTTKQEWRYTTITVEEGIDYRISSRGVNGEYSSIVGIDNIGGRHIILTGNNVYIKDHLLKSSDIEKYVSLVINTSDTNTSPIIVKKGKQIDIIKYIDDKVSPLEPKKTMLCNANGNACKIRFKYSKTKDCILLFTDYVNNCFKPSHIYLIDNVSDEIVWDFSGRDSSTQFTFINSEWISPYKNLNAVNNPITNVIDQWTGGSHAIGSIKTNKIKSVKVICDDVEVNQNADTKCNSIKIVCITEVTASNTTATVFEDNRYVLLEKQVWEITPNTFDVNVSFEFLEDCSLGVNYGLQTENTGFTKLRHYGDSSNLGLVNMKAYAYGSNKTVGIANGWCLKDDNGNTLEVLVDTAYKCGNRCLIKPDTPTIVTADYGKTYSYIISEASFKTGDIVEHRGQYKFYCAN